MLPAALLLLLGGLFIASVWDEIVGWLRKLFNSIKNAIRQLKVDDILHAASLFGLISSGTAKFIHYFYYKLKNGNWMEEKTRSEISEEKVPYWVRQKISGSNETEFTESEELRLMNG